MVCCLDKPEICGIMEDDGGPEMVITVTTANPACQKYADVLTKALNIESREVDALEVFLQQLTQQLIRQAIVDPFLHVGILRIGIEI